MCNSINEISTVLRILSAVTDHLLDHDLVRTAVSEVLCCVLTV